MIGSRIRKCQSNGKWSGNETSCLAVNCGPLPVLLNGSHVGDMTTYPNKVTSYCDEGFFLRGSKERFCQADRTWSGTQTICEAKDCGNLPVPINGSMIGNQTTYPNKLVFSCDAGFDLIGSNVRRCKADGKWSEEQPTCKAVDCGSLPGLLNGAYVGNLTTYPNKIRSNCNEGFLLRGSAERFCQTNRTWSGTQTICEAKDCGSLMAPKNGSMFGNQTTFPNEVSFRCDEGFIMTGPGKRRCQKDGTWSGNATLCAAVDCGTLHAPMNGSLHGDLTVFPESVRFSCDVGFIMSGPPVRHCQSNGSWSGNETVCNAIDCGKLSAPVNGTVYGEDTIYPNILQFTCDEGFTLYGATQRRCQSNGTWSERETTCQANDCGSLAVPRNGSFVGNKTTYPNMITFTCDAGFILIGSAVRQCQANKTWSGCDTYCQAIDCGSLGIPLNGSATGDLTVYPNIKHFTCDPGFILSGSSKRVCQGNGTWSGTKTTCAAIDCGNLPTPRNGSIHGEHTTYSNTLRFICDDGFTLVGSTIRKCGANGTWSGVGTVCKANDCGKLLTPQNGSLFGNITTYPNKVTFTCDEGFIIRGSKVRQCQADRTWTGNDTYCDGEQGTEDFLSMY